MTHILNLFKNERLKRKQKSGILFIDMAKAFDSVDREILFSHFRNKAQKGLTVIQIIKKPKFA